MMRVVGIDLGTTNTVVAAEQGGEIVALREPGYASPLLPSVVSFHPSGSVLVGESAKERRFQDAPNTIYSIKRLIGRSWNTSEVQRAAERFPFQLKEGPGKAPLVVARGTSYTLPEISAFVLGKAKDVAEAQLGGPVESAVVTVPASFNDIQRAATKVAARVAGFEVLRVLNEPTAAALAYGHGRRGRERIAIYDFGGGTFDITLLDLADNVFEVLGTAGDTFLGGDDIDAAIATRLADEVLKRHRVDAHADPALFGQLRATAERLKVQLSSAATAEVTLHGFAYGPGGKSIDPHFTLTRVELAQLCAPIVERTFDVCRQVVASAGLEGKQLDQVLLVGGSTRLEVVQQRVRDFFGVEPQDSVSPDEAVAVGAAIQASALAGEGRSIAVPAAPGQSVPPRRRQDTLHGTGTVRPPEPARSASRPPPSPSLAAKAVRRAPAPPNTTDRAAPSRERAQPRPGGATLVTPPGSSSPRKGIGTTQRFGSTTELMKGTATGSPRVPPRRAASSAEPAASPAAGSRTPPLGRTQPLGHLVPPEAGSSTRERAMPSRDRPGVYEIDEDALSDDELTQVLDEFASDRDSQWPTSERKQPAPESLPPEEALAPLPIPSVPAPADEPQVSRPAGLGATLPLPAPAAGFRPAPSPFASQAQAPIETQPGRPVPLPAPLAAAGATLPPGAVPASRPLLLDVTPLSLSVETVSGFCDRLVEANTPVPCEQKRNYVTSTDGQTVVTIRVAQGESKRFEDNTLLGEAILEGLAPAPRGQLAINVAFSLDTDGLLSVRATESDSGREVSARLQLVGLSEATDLDAMQKRFHSLERR